VKRALLAVRWVLLNILVMLVSLPTVLEAEQVDTYQKLQERAPVIKEEKKQNIIFDSSYEYSFVSIGARRIHWKLLSSRLMYFIRGQIPYLELNWHERDRVTDLTLAPGGYFQIGKTALHLETGFGLDTDYIYRFQTTVDIEHPIYKTLYWKVGSRYLHYESGDIFLIAPGLTYYFRDHYLTMNYGFSLTEARGDAHWGSIRANVVLHERFHVYVGSAIGERLFDISPVYANKQGGYIIFTGFNFNVFSNVKARAGYSYSEERPNFIKRSIDGGLTIRF